MLSREKIKKITAAVDAFLKEEMHDFQYDKESGMYTEDVYVPYGERLSHDATTRILEHGKYAKGAFLEKLHEVYWDAELEYYGDLERNCLESLTDEDGPFPEGLTDEEDEVRIQHIRDSVIYALPEEHYLKQEVRVPIMIDTGDANYDYTLNAVHSYHHGENRDGIDDKASLTWLAKQQGYSKEQLVAALNGDYEEDKFLETVYAEVANLCSHMGMLTFLTTMTLGELIKLNEKVIDRTTSEFNWDAEKRAEKGTITISKETMCGLFNSWSGGGSLFEIELKADVKLPIKYIRSALPDGADGAYGVDEVYGFIGSVWTKGTCTVADETIQK